jgi:hypothetical protein
MESVKEKIEEWTALEKIVREAKSQIDGIKKELVKASPIQFGEIVRGVGIHSDVRMKVDRIEPDFGFNGNLGFTYWGTKLRKDGSVGAHRARFFKLADKNLDWR